MESLIAAIKEPDTWALLGILFLWGEIRYTRRLFYQHEKECAERWGQVKTLLKIQD